MDPVAAISPTADLPPSNPFFKKKYFIIGTTLMLLSLMVLFSFLFLKSTSQNKAQKQTPSPTSSPYGFTPRSQTPPKVQFKSYTPVALPTLPGTVNTYILKSNFSSDEVQQFAQKFGLDTFETETTTTHAYSENINTRGILEFNSLSGAFSYQSFGSLHPRAFTQGESPQQIAIQFLQDLSLYDNTISCPDTYQIKGISSLTYVECHRDWSKLGMPLVSIPGVINLPETTRVGSLGVGKVDPNGPLNSSIINASSGANGKARPNDYNTITVGVFNDGRINFVKSNIRWITATNAINSSNLITPQDAEKAFRAQKATLSLTIPAGSGVIDWNKVYPENIASAKEAKITEMLLVYSEKPSSILQTTYEPYYLIRGTALLDSGYTVKFAEILPASSKTLQANPQVALQEAGKKKLQLGTFPVPTDLIPTTVKETPPVTVTKPLITAPPTPRPTRPPTVINTTCNGGDGRDITLDVPDFGKLVVVTGYGLGASHHFFLRSAEGTTHDGDGLNTIKDIFFRAVEEQYAINVAKYVRGNKIEDEASAKAIFSNMNQNSLMCGNINNDIPNPNPRPAPNICEGYSDVPYDVNQMRKSENNVAKRLVDASNKGQLASLASKPDLFPDESRTTFDWTFANMSATLGVDNPLTPCYISGASPVLFVYGPVGSLFHITPISPSYSDPALFNSSWDVHIDSEGALFDTMRQSTHPFLYYEYDSTRVVFPHISEGFVTKKDSANHVIRSIASKLSLNRQETDALLREYNNAARNVTTSYIKISLIPQDILNEKLPLAITPAPSTLVRVHLLLTPQNQNQSLKNPFLTPIKRGTTTVVELGARLQQ